MALSRDNFSASSFTFHNVSITTKAFCECYPEKINLHSTMFLLLHFLGVFFVVSEDIYIPQCFYYYRCRLLCSELFQDLHSTMFLLLLIKRSCQTSCECNLHSTMFLLLLKSIILDMKVMNLFTFHNVSITTSFGEITTRRENNLHSTMFLLLQKYASIWKFCTGIYIPQCFYYYFIGIGREKFEYLIYIPQCFYYYVVRVFFVPL